VFTALARKADTLARRPVLVGWLYRSAQFAASDAVRTERRRQAREQEAHAMNETERLSSDPDWDRLRPVLDEVLNDMDERDRDAVLLRFFDGHAFAEVGAKLQLTENAARMRVERALEKLRALLARRGVTSTTAALALALGNQAGAAVPAGLAATVTGVALAGAAGATGGLVVTFMSLTKLQIGIAAAVIAAGVGGVVWQRQALAEMQTMADTAEQQDRRVAALTEEKRRLAAEAADRERAAQIEVLRLREENEALKNRVVALTPAPAGKKNANRGAVAVPVTVTDGLVPTVAGSGDAAARLAQNRNLINRRYGTYFQQAGLAPEQREKLTQLLIDLREASVDFAAATATTGQDASKDREVFQGSVYALREQIQGQIKALLGDDGYTQFTAVDENVRQSAVVERMQKNLKATGGALSAEQSSQLVGVMRDLGVSYVSEDVVARAGGFLAPAQVAALQALQQRRQLGAQKENVQRAIGNNLPSAGAGPK
jgi:RNA polymerase sigma factor (sigma-70 family)